MTEGIKKLSQIVMICCVYIVAQIAMELLHSDLKAKLFGFLVFSIVYLICNVTYSFKILYNDFIKLTKREVPDDRKLMYVGIIQLMYILPLYIFMKSTN